VTSTLPLWLATALYIWQAAEYIRLGQPGMGWAFLGYACANLGFIYHTTTTS
jgi:hypothetical protein